MLLDIVPNFFKSLEIIFLPIRFFGYGLKGILKRLAKLSDPVCASDLTDMLLNLGLSGVTGDINVIKCEGNGIDQ